MNCKPGDLAIIVKSVAGNEGKIVRCIKLIDNSDGYFTKELGPVWEIDQQIPFAFRYVTSEGKEFYVQSNRLVNRAHDCGLRRIPPLNELDEVTKEIEEIA